MRNVSKRSIVKKLAQNTPLPRAVCFLVVLGLTIVLANLAKRGTNGATESTPVIDGASRQLLLPQQSAVVRPPAASTAGPQTSPEVLQRRAAYESHLKALSSAPDPSMPYKYPMHSQLPSPRRTMAEAVYRQQSAALVRLHETCWAGGAASHPIFEVPPPDVPTERDPVTLSSLEKEFGFRGGSSSSGGAVFFANDDSSSSRTSSTTSGARPWWISSEGSGDGDGNLPCTAEVQQRLYDMQHPKQKACGDVRFLVTKLKEGAHGIGSALTLVAHDLLSAMMVGRVLQVHTPAKWYFSSTACAQKQRGGWDCFFMPVAGCKAHGSVEVVNHRRQALRSGAQVIVKKSFDIDGLSRNDIPSDEVFFGPIRNMACYQDYQRWVQDPGNRYIQGTFARGSDPALFYMLAQALRYLMRAPQPWFQNMLAFHLPVVGFSRALVEGGGGGAAAQGQREHASSKGAVVYIQERGEIAKFREYFNVFGCHNVNSSIFVDFALRWCDVWRAATQQQQQRSPVDGNGAVPPLRPDDEVDDSTSNALCEVYISGNTPFRSYNDFAAMFESAGIPVRSTWKHPSVAGGSETERWGASSPASSWIDLFAGIASTNWVCVVQSNWCRVINLLRLTSGRASCGFVDAGALMISSVPDREKYCVIGPYPTKAFSNRLK